MICLNSIGSLAANFYGLMTSSFFSKKQTQDLVQSKTAETSSLVASKIIFNSLLVEFFQKKTDYAMPSKNFGDAWRFANLIFNSERVVTISQSELIPTLVALGYKTNPAGLCFGVVYMGIQAILSGDIRSFDQRLEKIALLISTQELLEIDKVDLLAFFDGIELYSQACRYPHLFEDEVRPYIQNDPNLIKALFPLVVSNRLKKKGGIFQVAHFSGLYTKNELEKYFQSLKETCIEENTPSFALQFSNAGHSIVVGYDPIEKNWIFINASKLSSIKYKDLNLLAEMVLTAFLDKELEVCSWESSLVALSSTLFVSTGESSLIQPQVTSWQNSLKFCEIHELSAAKAQLSDSLGYTWLALAAQSGDLEAVNNLIANGAEIDVIEPNGYTALELAAQNGHVKIVQVLLKAGSDLNINHKALVLASQNNHLEIVLALLDAGVAVDHKIAEGPSALMQAALCGHLQVIRVLLGKQADVNREAVDGATALMLAAQEGHLEAVQALLKAGADVSKVTTSGYTAYRLALENGQMQVIAVLEASV